MNGFDKITHSYWGDVVNSSPEYQLYAFLAQLLELHGGTVIEIAQGPNKIPSVALIHNDVAEIINIERNEDEQSDSIPPLDAAAEDTSWIEHQAIQHEEVDAVIFNYALHYVAWNVPPWLLNTWPYSKDASQSFDRVRQALSHAKETLKPEGWIIITQARDVTEHNPEDHRVSSEGVDHIPMILGELGFDYVFSTEADNGYALILAQKPSNETAQEDVPAVQRRPWHRGDVVVVRKTERIHVIDEVDMDDHQRVRFKGDSPDSYVDISFLENHYTRIERGGVKSDAGMSDQILDPVQEEVHTPAFILSPGDVFTDIVTGRSVVIAEIDPENPKRVRFEGDSSWTSISLFGTRYEPVKVKVNGLSGDGIYSSERWNSGKAWEHKAVLVKYFPRIAARWAPVRENPIQHTRHVLSTDSGDGLLDSTLVIAHLPEIKLSMNSITRDGQAIEVMLRGSEDGGSTKRSEDGWTVWVAYQTWAKGDGVNWNALEGVLQRLIGLSLNVLIHPATMDVSDADPSVELISYSALRRIKDYLQRAGFRLKEAGWPSKRLETLKALLGGSA